MAERTTDDWRSQHDIELDEGRDHVAATFTRTSKKHGVDRAIEILEWQIRDARAHKKLDRERVTVNSRDVEYLIARLKFLEEK